MHKETIEIDVFDIGDYVFTPNGKGFIMEVEKSSEQVMVQHKHGDKDNPNNLPKVMKDYIPILISKEEYDI